MMHNIQKRVLVLATAVGLLFGMQLANATLVNYIITGDVLDGNGGSNAFGLVAGDTITATGTFDDSPLMSGTGTIDFSSSSSNSMTINAGSQTLFASNDVDYLTGGGPTISLVAFGLTEVDYFATVGTNGATVDFSSFLGATNSFDDIDNFSLFGDWRTTIEITAVPVPAAVWLFGSGLLGLAGFARKKKV